jgi:hypothetical protein
VSTMDAAAAAGDPGRGPERGIALMATSQKAAEARHPFVVTGAQLGVPFPTNIESLGEQGARFLTAAFRASGAIAADNAVSEITRFEEFFGGGAGRKLRLGVRYAKLESGLHEDLFVKFPRNFGDPLRDLFSHLMESETRLALLSRSAEFPVPVPRCYFADYDPVSRSGILITGTATWTTHGFAAEPMASWRLACWTGEARAR